MTKQRDGRKRNRPGPKAGPKVQRADLDSESITITRQECFARMGRATRVEVAAYVNGLIHATRDPRVIVATVPDAAALVPALTRARATEETVAVQRGLDMLIAAAMTAAARPPRDTDRAG